MKGWERESEGGGLRMTEGREDEKWVKSGSGWKREVGCKEKRDMDGHSLDILYYLNLTSLCSASQKLKEKQSTFVKDTTTRVYEVTKPLKSYMKSLFLFYLQIFFYNKIGTNRSL